MRRKIKKPLNSLLVSVFLCALACSFASAADQEEGLTQHDSIEGSLRRATITKALDTIEAPTKLSPIVQTPEERTAQVVKEIKSAQEPKYRVVPGSSAQEDNARLPNSEPQKNPQPLITPEGTAQRSQPGTAENTKSAAQEPPKKDSAQANATNSESRRFLPDPIRPYVWAGTGYNDNIFLLKDKTGSMVNTLNPGVKLLWGTLDNTLHTNRLEFDGGASLYQFVNRSELDQALPYANASLQIGKNKHMLAITHSYRQQYCPQSYLALGLDGFENYTSNTSTVAWESAFNHFGFDLGYNRSAYDYQDIYKTLNTSVENIVSPTIFFQAYPKTRFFIGYDRGTVSYTKSPSNDRDNSYNRFWIGVKDSITEKTSGVIQAGYEDRVFGDSANNRGSVAVKTDLTFQYTPKLAFILDASKGSKAPSYARESFTDSTDFSLHALQHITEKLSLNSGIDYGQDKYRSGRLDNTLTFSTRLDFAYHKWLLLRGGYRYEQRNSNVNEADYNNNVFTLENRLAF